MTTTISTYTTPPCMMCGDRTVVALDRVSIERWRGGELVQNVFPDLDADARELLISGTHPACWAEMFGDEADD
jgi:hypothetical protein